MKYRNIKCIIFSLATFLFTSIFVVPIANADNLCITTKEVVSCNPDIYWAEYLNHYNVRELWNKGNGEGIIVSSIDSGVNSEDNDLKGKILKGYDLFGGDGSFDLNGHGTENASIIAGEPDNGYGIAGIAPGVKIIPINVFNSGGNSYVSDVIKAIYYSVDHGADIINMSFAGSNFDANTISDLEKAVKYAKSKNVIIVAASGNLYEKGNPIIYPAALEDVIAVASSDNSGGLATFSGRGNYVDFIAPGVGIHTVDNKGNNVIVEGTSVSAPIVTGLVALYLSIHPNVTIDTLINNIKSEKLSSVEGEYSEVNTKKFLDDLENDPGVSQNQIRATRVFGDSKVNIRYLNKPNRIKYFTDNSYSNILALNKDSVAYNGTNLYFTNGNYKYSNKIITIPSFKYSYKGGRILVTGFTFGTKIIFYDSKGRVVGSGKVGSYSAVKNIKKFCLSDSKLGEAERCGKL